MTSVSVFIDYENTRFGAREVFGDPQRDPYTFGHVRPLRLGLLLKQLGEKVDPARELTAVNVYRGRPGPKSGPQAQAGSARQFAAWKGSVPPSGGTLPDTRVCRLSVVESVRAGVGERRA